MCLGCSSGPESCSTSGNWRGSVNCEVSAAAGRLSLWAQWYVQNAFDQFPHLGSKKGT